MLRMNAGSAAPSDGSSGRFLSSRPVSAVYTAETSSTGPSCDLQCTTSWMSALSIWMPRLTKNLLSWSQLSSFRCRLKPLS